VSHWGIYWLADELSVSCPVNYLVALWCTNATSYDIWFGFSSYSFYPPFVLIILEFALVSLELYIIWHLLGDNSEIACFIIHIGVALSVGAKFGFCDSFNVAL
jgi:hypothetical protein